MVPKKATTSKPAPKKLAQTTLKAKAKPVVAKKRPKPDTDDEDGDQTPGHNSLHDDSLLSATPPSAKKQKKAPAPKKVSSKKSASKALQELENEAVSFDGSNDPAPKKGSGSTEQYQKVLSGEFLPFLMLTRLLAHTTRTHHQAA